MNETIDRKYDLQHNQHSKLNFIVSEKIDVRIPLLTPNVMSLVLRTKNEPTFEVELSLAKDNTTIALLKSTIKTP